MTAMPIGIDGLVRLTNRELAARGMPASTITAERERMTGHPRRIAPPYWRTLGWWGGVRGTTEIAVDLEIAPMALRWWAKSRRLRTRTKRLQRTQAQLAVLCAATPGPAREVGPKLGVLAAEACMYRAACELLKEELGVNLPAILAWSPEELEANWEACELIVEVDDPSRVRLYDDEALTSLVDEARSTLRGHFDLEEIVRVASTYFPPPDDGAEVVP